jgi:thiol-disulfide isomerase/thioredoxin
MGRGVCEAVGVEKGDEMSVRIIASVVVILMVVMGHVSYANFKAPNNFQIFSSRVDVPQTPLILENGKKTNISVFRGKTVVLNLWATWCLPCIKELPSLNQLSKTLPKDKFVVVLIGEDKGGLLAETPFLERLKVLDVISLADSGGKLKRMLGAPGLPTTFVVAPDGSVVGKIEGPIDWNTDEVRDFLFSIK